MTDLTINDVRELKKVSSSTIRRWCKSGLPHYKIGNTIRITSDDLKNFLGHFRREYALSEKFLINALTSLSPFDNYKAKGGIGKLAKKQSTCTSYGFGSVFSRETQDKTIRWYYYFRNREGKRIRRVVPHATSREQALSALKEAVFIEFIQNEGRKPRLTFKELAEVFLSDYSRIHKRSWKSDEKYLQEVVPFLGSMYLDKITPRHIQAYISKRLQSGKVKKNSINRHLQLLRKMFNWAAEQRYEVGENPVRPSMLFNELEFARTRALTEDEEKLLLAAAAPHVRNILVFALQTGCRLQEILRLRVEDVDFERDEITIRAENNKTGRLNRIPMNSTVKKLIRALILENGKRSEYVFTYFDRKTKTLRPVKSIKKGFLNACGRAKVKDFQFRDTRRTFASRLYAQGVDPLIVQRLLRHSSFKISEQVYIQSNMKMMKDAMETLNKRSKKRVICPRPVPTGKEEESENLLSFPFSMN